MQDLRLLRSAYFRKTALWHVREQAIVVDDCAGAEYLANIIALLLLLKMLSFSEWSLVTRNLLFSITNVFIFLRFIELRLMMLK